MYVESLNLILPRNEHLMTPKSTLITAILGIFTVLSPESSQELVSSQFDKVNNLQTLTSENSMQALSMASIGEIISSPNELRNVFEPLQTIPPIRLLLDLMGF